ncbi:MAG: helix-turn-helix transcriptional regulator [Oscillospiraceae bacterium]|nr:helix-turn-helix transcriptional regulator [Oscillospiraceae bacterium]
MAETMGHIIRRLRKEQNLTQEELAEQLNISAPAISKWENDTGMPDISQVVPIAKIFGVSTDVLFGTFGESDDDEAMKIIYKAQE